MCLFMYACMNGAIYPDQPKTTECEGDDDRRERQYYIETDRYRILKGGNGRTGGKERKRRRG